MYPYRLIDRPVLEGIGQVVGERLPDAASVGDDRHQLVWGQDQLDVARASRLLLVGDGLLHDGDEILSLHRQLELVQFQPGYLQQFLHQAGFNLYLPYRSLEPRLHLAQQLLCLRGERPGQQVTAQQRQVDKAHDGSERGP